MMEIVDKFLRITAYVAIVAIFPLLAFLITAAHGFPVLSEPDDISVSVEFPRPALIQEAPWSVLMAVQSAPLPSVEDSLAKRFRLAGTLSFASPDVKRRAILDDLLKNMQVMLSEGESTDDGITLVKVFDDRVVLRNGGVEETLFLDFITRTMKDGDGSVSGDTAGSVSPQDEVSFGLRTGETRWELSRDKMMSYYHEVMDDPERLIKVFDSFKPLYDEEKRITGYILDVEGETEMFNAFGLNEGDIIRTLNAMNMVSQSRGEYFLREFAEERVNAFVLDIERNGESRRLTYLVR